MPGEGGEGGGKGGQGEGVIRVILAVSVLRAGRREQDFVQSCNSGSDVVGLVLDRTPLYAEQGGQIFDKAPMRFNGLKCTPRMVLSSIEFPR